MRKIIGLGLAVALTLGLSAAAWATNGMNMISYGAQEAGMGGAMIGVSNNALAVNNNPAGLTQIHKGDFTGGGSILMPSLHHEDMMGNNLGAEATVYAMPNLSFAYKFGKLTGGLGIFSQGGMGAHYKGLNTAFGTKDETYTNVAYGKLAPSLAYEINEYISIGAAMNVGYSTMEMRLFPNTAVPNMFYGMNLRDSEAWGVGAKFGIQVKPNKMLTLGLVYTMQADMTYDGGTMTYSGIGEFDAKVKGFNWPRSLGFGVGFRPGSRWLLAADVTWVNWSSAVDKVTIETGAPGMLSEVEFPMEWNDQIVVAVGAAFDATDWLTLRMGYNYGTNPVPDENLSPLFPAIPEHHLTGGFGLKFSEHWFLDAALEYAFENSVTYTNPNAPFGVDAVEKHSQISVHASVSYRW